MNYKRKINTRHEKEAKNTTLCLKLDIRCKMFANNSKQDVAAFWVICVLVTHFGDSRNLTTYLLILVLPKLAFM